MVYRVVRDGLFLGDVSRDGKITTSCQYKLTKSQVRRHKGQGSTNRNGTTW